MTMAAAGVAKLIEECGELQQVCGKRLAYWTTDDHPDGTNLKERMEDEMADVCAAIDFVIEQKGLDRTRISLRWAQKMALFETWQEQLDNNDHGIDGRRNEDE